MRTRHSVTAIRQAVEQLIYLLNGTTLVPVNSQLPLGDTRPITGIPENHIYPNFSLVTASTNDEDYPKVSLAIDGGVHARGVSQEINERIGFDVAFVVKQVDKDLQPEVHIISERVIDDFRLLIEKNPTLFDTAMSLDIGDWVTDSGMAYPEGIIWFKLVVTLRS